MNRTHQDGAREALYSVWLYMVDKDGEPYSLPCSDLEDALRAATANAMYGIDGAEAICIKNKSHQEWDALILVSMEGIEQAISETKRRERVKDYYENGFWKKPESFSEFCKRTFCQMIGVKQP